MARVSAPFLWSRVTVVIIISAQCGLSSPNRRWAPLISLRRMLVHELNQRGFHTAVQLPLPVIYDAVRLDLGFRRTFSWKILSLWKSRRWTRSTQVHQAQLLTYLKLSHKHLGLLINFNVVHLRDGIRRMVSGDPPSISSVSSVVRPVSSESSVSSVVSSRASTAKQAS